MQEIIYIIVGLLYHKSRLVSLSGMVETLAFRRSNFSIVAERLVIPAKAGIQERWS